MASRFKVYVLGCGIGKPFLHLVNQSNFFSPFGVGVRDTDLLVLQHCCVLALHCRLELASLLLGSLCLMSPRSGGSDVLKDPH